MQEVGTIETGNQTELWIPIKNRNKLFPLKVEVNPDTGMESAQTSAGDDTTVTGNTRRKSETGGSHCLQPCGIRRTQRRGKGRELERTLGQGNGREQRRMAVSSEEKLGCKTQHIKSSDTAAPTIVEHRKHFENEFDKEKCDQDLISVHDVISTKIRQHKGEGRKGSMKIRDICQKPDSQPQRIKRNAIKGCGDIETGQSESKHDRVSLVKKKWGKQTNSEDGVSLVKKKWGKQTNSEENTQNSAIGKNTLGKKSKRNELDRNGDKIFDVGASLNENNGKRTKRAVKSRKRLIEIPEEDNITKLPHSDRNRNAGKQKSDVHKNPTCPICKKVFTSKTKVLCHIRNQHGKSHICTKCLVLFENVSDLRKHALVHKPFLCDKCGNAYIQMNALNFHIRTAHDGIRLYTCDYEGCTKTFADKCNKKKHINAKHLNMRKEKCEWCSKMFKNKSALKVHVYAYHTDDSQKLKLPCQVCGKVFMTATALRQHLTLHSNVKPYECSHDGCNKKFRLTCNRTKHEMMHANIRPFKCDVCDQSFSRKEYLRSHAYKHTGEKAHSCSVCDKTFTQKGNLTAHMAVHSDTRELWMCDKCKKSFTFKSNLTKHKLSHHRNSPASSRESSPSPHEHKPETENTKTLKTKIVNVIANNEKMIHKPDSSSTPTISVMLKFPNSSALTKTAEIGCTIVVDHTDIGDVSEAGDDDYSETITDNTQNIRSKGKKIKSQKRELNLSPSGKVLMMRQIKEPLDNESVSDENTESVLDAQLDTSPVLKVSIADNPISEDVHLGTQYRMEQLQSGDHSSGQEHKPQQTLTEEDVTEPKVEQIRSISELKLQSLQDDTVSFSNDEGVEVQDRYTKECYTKESNSSMGDQVKIEVTETLIDAGGATLQVTNNGSIMNVKRDPDECTKGTNSDSLISCNIPNDVSRDDVTENSAFFGTGRFADFLKKSVIVKSDFNNKTLPELSGMQHTHHNDVNLSTSPTITDNSQGFSSLSAELSRNVNSKLKTESQKFVNTDYDSASAQNTPECNLQSMSDCDFMTFPIINSVTKVTTIGEVSPEERLLTNIEDVEHSNDTKSQLTEELFQTPDTESDQIVSGVESMKQFHTIETNIQDSIPGTVNKMVVIEIRNREMVVLDKYTDSTMISDNTIIDTIAENSEQKSEDEISALSLIENL